MNHPHSDRPAFNRLMLLIAAIANNPGIAPSGTGVSSVQILLDGMKRIAIDKGIPWKDWSEPTIWKDLATLRQYGIVERMSRQGGFYIGIAPEPEGEPLIRQQKRRKSKLSPSEIVQLRDTGKSLAEVADIAGISREAVRQAEMKERKRLSHEGSNEAQNSQKQAPLSGDETGYYPQISKSNTRRPD